MHRSAQWGFPPPPPSLSFSLSLRVERDCAATVSRIWACSTRLGLQDNLSCDSCSTSHTWIWSYCEVFRSSDRIPRSVWLEGDPSASVSALCCLCERKVCTLTDIMIVCSGIMMKESVISFWQDSLQESQPNSQSASHSMVDAIRHAQLNFSSTCPMMSKDAATPKSTSWSDLRLLRAKLNEWMTLVLNWMAKVKKEGLLCFRVGSCWVFIANIFVSISLLRPYTFFSRSPLVFKTLFEYICLTTPADSFAKHDVSAGLPQPFSSKQQKKKMPTFLNLLVLFLELSGRCGASSRRSCR